jgi:hypothetical protein
MSIENIVQIWVKLVALPNGKYNKRRCLRIPKKSNPPHFETLKLSSKEYKM